MLLKSKSKKRLTSKMVISGLKKQKAIPVAGCFDQFITIDEKTCYGMCALGAVYGPDGPSKIESSSYVEGVAAGFDDNICYIDYIDNYNDNELIEFLKGFCDGVKIHVDALKAFGFLTKE